MFVVPYPYFFSHRTSLLFMASVRTVELDETADRNYDCPVRIEPDPAKSERNARFRGLSFELVAGFDWETAVYREDSRRAYPERRIVALGSVGPRLCVGASVEGTRLLGLVMDSESLTRCDDGTDR